MVRSLIFHRFLEFQHSTNSNFFTNSNFSRHSPLGDLYESFVFLSWSLSIIHMVTYFKKHKNHLSAIIAPMLKTVYVENSEQFYLMQKIVLLSEQFYIQLIRTFLQIQIFRGIHH